MDKVVLITGGSRGIGAATAKFFASKGYIVCLNYLSNQRAAENVRQVIEQEGGKCDLFQADVTEEHQVVNMFNSIVAKYGYLDILVNNAGTLSQQMPLTEMSLERFESTLKSNTVSTFLCSKAAVKLMSTELVGRGGAIVNVSSKASVTGSPNEYVDYAAAKGAVDTLTKGLAMEVATQGIRVNAVRPGLIYTDIHASGGEPDRVDRLKSKIPMQRGGKAEEVAKAIYWLASDDASFTTGTCLDVTGGL